MNAYIKKITENNHQNQNINAVITMNEQALTEARTWDEQNKGQKKNPPLAGIPFLVKDNFNTKGILTTGGSVALETSKPDSNAFVVQKLLDEGAILLGKTNMSELSASYGWLGYSSFGGQTLNPLNTLRDASGSSSGSAAAVTANFAPFALGTDTSGSIRGPASVTGNVGLRPTLGLTSRSGIIPLSLTSDNAGVITRTVQDQAIVLDAIQGEDKADAATLQVKRADKPFALDLNSSYLKGKRIAVVDNFDGGNPDVDNIKKQAEQTLEQAGAKITHITLPKEYENLWGLVLGPVGTAEFRPQFDAYLASLPDGQPQNTSEFMKRLSSMTDNGTLKINPARYKGLQESANSKTTDSPEYISILSNTIPKLRAELTAIMTKGQYDAFFFPTMSCPGSVVNGKSDPSYICKSSDAYAASYIASSTGFPEVTVPAGRATANMPVGVSFLGLAGEDEKVLKLAYSFEKHSH
ncbi:amidase family protein [Brenneria alni]|uniref:amidase family protein n=1 Tax=Brenneria alni TaxID=71656 RepID=UPI001F0C28F4|nr:amidase family protein [Brenneria alni]